MPLVVVQDLCQFVFQKQTLTQQAHARQPVGLEVPEPLPPPEPLQHGAQTSIAARAFFCRMLSPLGIVYVVGNQFTVMLLPEIVTVIGSLPSPQLMVISLPLPLPLSPVQKK